MITNETIRSLRLAQIGWVVPDIESAVRLLTTTLGVHGFPEAQLVRAQDLNMTYFGKVVAAEWLTTQAYDGNIFIELVQPLSGQSMFHDYIERRPSGGVQHHAFRLSIEDFQEVTDSIRSQGFATVSEVDHPIARMAFFDTTKVLGVVTEIMGVTPQGWTAIEQMEKAS